MSRDGRVVKAEVLRSSVVIRVGSNPTPCNRGESRTPRLISLVVEWTPSKRLTRVRFPNQAPRARMAEMVKATDSSSVSKEHGFESHSLQPKPSKTAHRKIQQQEWPSG
jgi:hypothetical protein